MMEDNYDNNNDIVVDENNKQGKVKIWWKAQIKTIIFPSIYTK